jgi:2-polyprenyl-3-methyl-5-hydroxy-6-metoxy-1,4-benzoquinol methylase
VQKSTIKQTFNNIKLFDNPLVKYFTIVSSDVSKPHILDIGCGNHSPSQMKHLFPESVYTGVDIAEYNIDQGDKDIADHLHILNCDPVDFAKQLDLALTDNIGDIVVMKHVIEHLSSPFEVLEVLCKKVKPSGLVYLTFPSEKSVFFPSAAGTLNFYDDPTHIWIPSIREISNFLVARDFQPISIDPANRGGILHMLMGILSLPLQAVEKILTGKFTANYGTWCLFGFESVMVYQKNPTKDEV